MRKLKKQLKEWLKWMQNIKEEEKIKERTDFLETIVHHFQIPKEELEKYTLEELQEYDRLLGQALRRNINEEEEEEEEICEDYIHKMYYCPVRGEKIDE